MGSSVGGLERRHIDQEGRVAAKNADGDGFSQLSLEDDCHSRGEIPKHDRRALAMPGHSARIFRAISRAEVPHEGLASRSLEAPG